MSSPLALDLTIYQGATFKKNLVWGCGRERIINALSLGATTTVTSLQHGYSTGQNITLTGIKGPISLNGSNYTITVIDANTFSLDGIDSTGLDPYLEGGFAVIPIDLTGYTALMHIRSKQGSDQVLIELSTSNGRISLGGTSGAIDLLINATDTAALKKGKYVYDLELISAGSEVTRLVEGSVEVDPETTR